MIKVAFKIITIIFIVFTFLVPEASGKSVDEYQLKAAFIERLTRFVEYVPEQANIGDIFTITILGDNPFGTYLDEMYGNNKILGKRVVINYINQLDQIEYPDILYVGIDKHDKIEQVLDRVLGMQVLTITDSDVYHRSGVVLNMKLVKDKLRFEIDIYAAQRQGMKFSRVLLAYATIVNDEETK